MAVTIKDVAEKVGVSVTTVSRVLNNRGYLSESLKQKVNDAMEELNYHPSEVARSLLRKKSNIIGLILPDISHPFFGEVTKHIEAYAYEQGYKLMLCNSLHHKKKEKEYIDLLRASRVDGIIMGSHTMSVNDYKSINLPLVSLDRQISKSIPFIASDNYQGECWPPGCCCAKNAAASPILAGICALICWPSKGMTPSWSRSKGKMLRTL